MVYVVIYDCGLAAVVLPGWLLWFRGGFCCLVLACLFGGDFCGYLCCVLWLFVVYAVKVLVW